MSTTGMAGAYGSTALIVAITGEVARRAVAADRHRRSLPEWPPHDDVAERAEQAAFISARHVDGPARSRHPRAAHRCGLRRDELVNLTFEHLQQREGRWIS